MRHRVEKRPCESCGTRHWTVVRVFDTNNGLYKAREAELSYNDSWQAAWDYASKVVGYK